MNVKSSIEVIKEHVVRVCIMRIRIGQKPLDATLIKFSAKIRKPLLFVIAKTVLRIGREG